MKVKSAVRCKSWNPPTCKSLSLQYGSECRRNEGKENALIAEAEIQVRSLTVIVSREYLDFAYLLPKQDRLIQADTDELVGR